MNNLADDKLSAMLTGLASTWVYHWSRSDRNTQDRIDQHRNDLDAIGRRMNELLGNGHILRDSSPVVADLLSGVAMSRSEEQLPSLLPSLETISRPQLTNLLASAVANFQWPPKAGEYTPQGYIKKAGELVSLGLSLTFEEVRAFVLGLVLDSSPTSDQKLQLLYAARGLARAIIQRQSTEGGWRALWDRVFGPLPHGAAPTVATAQPNVTLQLLTGARDSAMVIRATIGAGGTNAGAEIVQVTFGTSYNNVPAVVSSPIFNVNANAVEFRLIARQGFAPGDVVIIPVVVGSTDG